MNIFQSIANFFDIIVSALENLWNNLITFYDVVLMAFTLPSLFGTFLPAILFSSAFIFVAIRAIFMLIGR